LVTVVLVVALVGGTSFAARRAAAAGAPFWERMAEPARARCDRLVGEAEALMAGGDTATPVATRLARAEALVRQALELVPDDFRALMLRAEIAARAERPAAIVEALERACPRAPRGTLAGTCWFRLGVERSRLGQLEDALRAYERLIALGEADGAAYANAGEILMALGRLEEAEARYREAIRQDAPTPSAARRENAHGLTLSTYGLAVVLDRAGRPGPAREMMGRALLLDPRLAKLRAAEQPGGDVFFLPEGDVFYYLGLASEIAGRVDDAEAAYQEFLGRLPKSRWAPLARAHIEALEARGRVGRTLPRGGGLRVVAAGTVMASGPIPAPLVDAAWRAHPPRVDECFDGAVTRGALLPRESFRLSLELTLDARGAVSEAAVKAPANLDATLARCVETAVQTGLRVARPRKAAPTRARMELLVGLASGEPGGV
jgi:tetratricopeptide (TPR) repeat protein